MQSIEAPAYTGAVGGLLAVANVVELRDDHLGYLGVAYQSGLLGPARLVPDPTVLPVPDKIFDSLQNVVGEPFAVYHGIELGMMQPEAGFEQMASDALEAGQGWAVERYFLEQELSTRVDITPTPGTPVSGPQAVGLLEEYAGNNYMGLPTLHVGRFGAALLPDQFEWESGSFTGRTEQGSLLANGAGYTRDSATFPQFWAYVTGQVTVHRTKIRTYIGFDQVANRKIALAERVYVITTEGPVAGVLGSQE